MELVTQTELAALLGVTQPAISKRIRLGKISYTDPARKLFDPVAARAQWAAHRERYRAPTAAAAAGPMSARDRRDLAEAQLAELALREKTGELVRRRDVETATFQAHRGLRDRFINLADRIAPQVPGDDDLRRVVHGLIVAEVRATLRQVCEDLAEPDPAAAKGAGT